MYLAEIKRSYQSEPSHPDSEQDHALTTACLERLLANAYNELPNTDIHHVSVSELRKENSATLPMTLIISRRH